MKILTIPTLFEAYAKKKYKLFNGVDENAGYKFKLHDLNLGAVRMSERDQSADNFNDIFFCLHKLTTENWALICWPCTTEPGLHYLNNPMNPKGAAILQPGQYTGMWEIGKHYDQKALIQKSPVRVYRDNDKDNVIELDPATIDAGKFGINCHHKVTDTEKIGQGSAGCQVFKKTSDHEDFMELCESARKNWGNSFSFTLFDESDLS